MTTVFIKLLNMSIAASWLVLAVILLRIILKNAPKWIRCILWGLVAIRLICPFSIESKFSLLPSAETIQQDIIYADKPTIHTGIMTVNIVVNPYLSENMSPQVGNSVNPMQVVMSLAALLWGVGMIAMFVYAFVSFLKIKNRTDVSLHVRDNIYLSDYIDTPFVLGILRPGIYLPSTLEEDDKADFVIAHEKAHIRRHDHWWKPFGFLLLTIYWFNPVIWIAYILFCRDIELACDEYVIGNLKETEKKAYSEALLSCSMRSAGFHRNRISACPLAFGEVGVKDRVKAVLHYKRPAFWLVLLGVLGCIIVAVCFLTDPKDNSFVVKEETPALEQYQPEEIIGISYKDFQELTGVTAEHYHADFYSAEISTLGVTAIFLAEGWDDENAMAVLRNEDRLIRVEGRLDKILDEIVEESRLLDFVSMNLWNNKLVDYRIEEGAGTAYYVADRFASIKYDLNGDGVADRELRISLDNTDTIFPDTYCWLVLPTEEVENIETKAKRNVSEALEKAIDAGYVVHMDGDVTNGQETWEDFLDKVEEGKTASVRLAWYYTLDREGCSEEYYEANKDDYPVLYLQDLYFDGKSYTLEWKEGNEEYVRNYRYLMHYTGEAPTANATFDTYIRYVLVNDQKVTWEDIQRGMFSSRYGDAIAHNTVYVDLQR